MNRVKKWVGVFLVVGVISFFVFSAQPVSAGIASDYGVSDIDNIKPAIQKLEWIDAAHIKMTFKNGKTLDFTPGGVKDNNRSPFQDERLSVEPGYGVRYVAPEADGWTCNIARVEFDIDENRSVYSKQSLKLAKAHVDIDFRLNTDNDCSDGNEFDMDIEHPELSIAYFKWVSPEQIGMVDDDWPGIFTKGTTTATIDNVVYDVFLSDRESGADSCQNKLLLNRAANTVRFYNLGDGGEFDGNPPDDVSTSCNYYDRNEDDRRSWPRNNYDWGLANISSSVVGIPPTTSGPGGTNTESGDSCEGAIDNGFGWIICPILDGADKLINVTENTIQSKLEVNSEFTDNEGLHDAWTQLARISSGLLVIVALVMIISTALGFEMVSSYTIKKMLPRIVIGAIGIWLSWVLATNYVNFMNDLGRGIADIMFSPFKDTLAGGKTFAEVDLKYIVTKSFATTDAGTDLAALGILSGVFAVPVISLVFGSGGPFGLLLAAIPLIGAMLIGLFLLTVRQILIVFLLVMAPIGVAGWMLPNTQKTWKLWSGTFNKLLLMYPLFMGAFAAGKIFALIAADATKTDNGVLEVVVPMLAYIAPFFFLPLLFKLAGSIFSNITGMVNDRGKGIFDRSRGMKEQVIKNRKEDKQIDRRMRLAEGGARNRRPGDLFRDIGQVGFSSKARQRRRQHDIAQGHKDNLERQMFAGGVPQESARIQVTNFNPTAEKARLAAAETKLKAEAAGAVLENGYKAHVDSSIQTGAAPTSAADWYAERAINTTGAEQQAALDILTGKLKAVEQLETISVELNTSPGATAETKFAWQQAISRNFSEINEIAPHISRSDTAGVNLKALSEASAESAAKWRPRTWETLNTNLASLTAEQQGATQRFTAGIEADNKLWNSLGAKAQYEVQKTLIGLGATPTRGLVPLPPP